MNYEIRQVKPEEVKTALDLTLHVFMEFEAPVYEKEAVSKFLADCIENEQYINNYISGKHLMLGAFDSDQIIGLVSERGNGRISILFLRHAMHSSPIFKWEMNAQGIQKLAGSNEHVIA